MASKKVKSVLYWKNSDVDNWLESIGMSKYKETFQRNSVSGLTLLMMKENDLRCEPMSLKNLGDIKTLTHELHTLQMANSNLLIRLGYVVSGSPQQQQNFDEIITSYTANCLDPDLWKSFVSLLYMFVVSWVTAFIMVIVHNRVPDMNKYPPLPDIVLDNIPYIPWAFAMCEWTLTILLCVWCGILIVHKHRFILIRRFFSISGTVFLLRCFSMLITSLSVPGTHLQCNPLLEDYKDGSSTFAQRIKMASYIWRNAGLSIQGVKTCGDYMFSGHTSSLTLLNFFITEYTPRRLYYLHTFTWLLNMFGIFFILAAHEHYSIDVFIAFYITSRLFLYYHTLSNNQALVQRDSYRTKIWFPLFSFFESKSDGLVPNEYQTPIEVVVELVEWIKGGRVEDKEETTPENGESEDVGVKQD